MIITDPRGGREPGQDAEYEALYRDILPELDTVLWLIEMMTGPCLWMSISGDTSAPGTSAGAVCGDTRPIKRTLP